MPPNLYNNYNIKKIYLLYLLSSINIIFTSISNYQKYVTTGDESRKELENMGKEICEAIGCDYEISDKCREKREKELKKYKDLLGI